MLVYPRGSTQPLRPESVYGVVLRTDLTPIPASIEIDLRDTDETRRIKEGSVLTVGGADFDIIKIKRDTDTASQQGGSRVGEISAIGVLSSCAAIARPLQRSVIRYNSSLGEIYRACGAVARINQDFNVPAFACLVGQTPSFAIARVLQEEGGVLAYRKGRVEFRRLIELKQEKASRVMAVDSTEAVGSAFAERHAVPFAFSTEDAGGAVLGRGESGRSVVYRPRADQRIVNNLSAALIQRRRAKNALTPGLNAGDRVDVGALPHVVITAAHVFRAGTGGGSVEQYTRLWLGEVVL